MTQSTSRQTSLADTNVSANTFETPPIASVRELDPATVRINPTANEHGLFERFNEKGEAIGWVARTLPVARDTAGYRGPTEALLLLDEEQTIEASSILISFDTQEHVDQVKQSASFFDQFRGLTWGGYERDGSRGPIDGVSGATLTSLAFAEGLFQRLGDSPRLLVFPQPLSIDDARRVFPTAMSVQGDPVAIIRDAEDSEIGTLIRTGGLVDDEIGYQGPTELLLGVLPDGKTSKPVLRESFDNEPYVGYVPQEASFWTAFTGKTLEQLADLDVQTEGIEGVSGATMTSMAIAHTLPQAAKKILERGDLEAWTQPPVEPSFLSRAIRQVQLIFWKPSEIATLGFLLMLALLIRTGEMRDRSLRLLWLLTMITLFGLWTGNLVSLALVAGWVTSGVSWYLAVGLLAVVIVTFLLPPANRSNPYCNHLCPHGAAQQLLRPTSGSWRKRNLPRGLQKWLHRLPAVSLAAVYLVLLFRPSTDVSGVEPFHAYLWQVASLGSIAFAVGTLAFSAFIPMGYCRLGCPTGRLIEYVRFKSTCASFSQFDLALVALLTIAIYHRVV